MKKLTSLFVSIIMMFTVLSPGFAYANTIYESAQINLLQAGSYDIQEYSVDNLSIPSYQAESVEQIIYDSLLNFESSIRIYKYKLNLNDMLTIYTNVINDNPELFYVSSTVSYNMAKDNGETVYSIYDIFPRYSISTNEIPQAKEIYERGIQKALRLVDDTMNDAQKALIIHDYIINSAVYPKLNIENGQVTNDDDMFHCAYGFFYNKTIVCAGYTLSYSAILKRLNIPCKYVVSNEMGHAWNAVQIDGNWYNVDLTFDDIAQQGQKAPGLLVHNCFLKSDEAMKTSKCFWHSGMLHYSGVTCTDTKFDNYFWNDVNTSIYADNGDYIYAKYTSSDYLVNIVRRTVEGNESILNTNSMYAASLSYSSKNNSTGEIEYMKIPLSKFVKLDNQYIISYQKLGEGSNCYIDIFDLNSKTSYNIAHEADYNYLLGVDNGEIEYSLYNSQQTFKSIPRMEKFVSYYNGESSEYNPYIDSNNDKKINAKDFAAIYNASRGM